MMTLDYTEVIVAALGALSALGMAWFNYRKKDRAASHEHARADQAELEMKFQRAALSFSSYLEEWSVIEAEARRILEETVVDRFMILRAWNGTHDPRWTTAVYQMRLAGQEPVQYVHFELDEDYQTRLREISARNYIHFMVNDIPDSNIRRIYEAEGVTNSAWFLIDEQKPEGTDAKAITYCSFATHKDEPMPEEVLTRCQVLVGRLKGASASFKG